MGLDLYCPRACIRRLQHLVMQTLSKTSFVECLIHFESKSSSLIPCFQVFHVLSQFGAQSCQSVHSCLRCRRLGGESVLTRDAMHCHVHAAQHPSCEFSIWHRRVTSAPRAYTIVSRIEYQFRDQACAAGRSVITCWWDWRITLSSHMLGAKGGRRI
jgi:hypothetical protein